MVTILGFSQADSSASKYPRRQYEPEKFVHLPQTCRGRSNASDVTRFGNGEHAQQSTNVGARQEAKITVVRSASSIYLVVLVLVDRHDQVDL